MILLSVEAFPHIIFTVQFLFTVLERNSVSTYDSIFYSTQNPKWQTFLIFPNGKNLLYYLIQVKKSRFITVKTFWQDIEMSVHDGPGLLSSVIQQIDNRYVASSFQCTMIILILSQASSKLSNLFVSEFVSNNIDMKNISYNEMFASPLPVDCQTNLCILKLNAKPGYQVNVTLVGINFNGQQSPLCFFGGLVVSEELRGDYKEHLPVCKSLGDESKHFFSLNSSIMIVTYNYKHYSSISATVRISQTKCKPVQICDCTFEQYCWPHQRDELMYNCKQYLAYITRHSNVILSFLRKPTGVMKMSVTGLTFDLPDRECFILQIIRKMSHFQTSTLLRYGNKFMCRLDVSSTITKGSDTTISYTITGSMRPPVVNVESIPTQPYLLENRKGYSVKHQLHEEDESPDFREVIGFGGRFRHLNDNRNVTHRNKFFHLIPNRNAREQNLFSFVQQSFSKTEKIFISTK